MNILIVGGAGFIGSHLAKHILANRPKDRVVILDNLSSGSLNNISEILKHPHLTYIEGSITDANLLEKAFEQHNVQTIVEAIDTTDPANAIDTYVQGTNTLLQTAVKHQEQIERFIYLSSDEVYGDTINTGGTVKNASENDPLRPSNIISTGQAAADILVRGYHNEYHLPTLILRPTNVFGAYMRKDRLLSRLILSAINNENIIIYGDGSHTRDWLYIDDLISFLILCIYDHLPENQNIFNLSTEIPHTIIETTEIIITLLDKSRELITFDKDKTPNTIRKVIDADRAVELFNWKPDVDFQSGLKLTTDWFITHYGQNTQSKTN